MNAPTPSPLDDSAQPRRTGLTVAELPALLPGAAVVCVLLLAHVLFGLSGLDLQDLHAATIAERAAVAPAMRLGEAEARTLWLATALLYLVVNAGAATAACWIVGRRLRGACLRQLAVATAAVCAAGVIHLVLAAAFRWPVAGIFLSTRDALADSPLVGAGQLAGFEWIVGPINILSVLVPATVLAAGCAVLVPPAPDTPRRLSEFPRRMRLLRDVLNAASAILVVGVFHMLAWLRWPIALIDPSRQADLQALATAIVFYWGTAFTLMIAALYVPAAAMLSRQAEAALRQARPEDRPEDPTAWLRQQGLTIMPAQQLPQIVVMLAPLLAGPLGSALSGFAQPVLGS